MNVGLAMAGVVLMLVGIALLRLLSPRPGGPESRWLSSEVGALLAAVLIMVLLLFGATMLVDARLGE